MKISKAFAGLALITAVISTSAVAQADKPADDFINPQTMGPRLTVMPLIGPGIRLDYDHRFEIEKDISELRTQLITDVVVPYGEVSANVDIRLFLLTFGASVGYHDEWHLLQFQPNYDLSGDPAVAQAGVNFGRDLAGQRRTSAADGSFFKEDADGNVIQDPSPHPLPPKSFSDLTREARRVKDQNADVQNGRWPYYEGRVGFVAPTYHFLMVSTAAIRYNYRPNVSYDWANATVMNGGWHLRWETYAFFRDPKIGFIGPALRLMNVPRNRLTQDGRVNIEIQRGQTLPYTAVKKGDACQQGPNIPCEEVREWEPQYGIIGGITTSWVTSSDVFLVRAYTTYGLHNDLFGTHLFGFPIQLLFAYQMDIDL